jgi:peptidylprolyl isomerase
MARHRILAALIAALFALTIAACGDDDKGGGESTGTETAEAVPTTPAQPADISADLAEKPVIAKPSEEAPTKLIKEDVVVGEGPTVKEGDAITVHYVGVNYSTGDQFDASWDRGEPATFQLAQGQLIDGWVKGIPGMKVGGRRMLVIPPDLGYGAEGSPPAIPPNETLIFVIDVKKIG